MTICCPKCGSDDGYITRRRVVIEQWYDYDGEHTYANIDRDNNAMEKRKKCARCLRDITSYVDSLKKEPK